MKTLSNTLALPLRPEFMTLLAQEWQKAIDQHLVADDVDLILNFRDPDYSAESGGFHPVEIYIQATGTLLYITDFGYVGLPPYAELAKALDFDFGLGVFGQGGYDYPIAEGQALFDLFQQNFCSYVAMEVFTLSVSAA